MNRLIWLTLLMSPLVACDDDTTLEETGVIEDSGVVDEDPLAQCADGETVLEGQISVGAGRQLPEGAIRVGAWSVDLEADEPGPMGAASFLGGTADPLSADAGVALRFCVPAVAPEADLRGEEGSVKLATYLVGAWSDADANDEVGLPEPIVGVQRDMLTYVSGEVPEIGLTEGWHWMELDFENDGEILGITALSESASLDFSGSALPLFREALQGSITPATGNTDTRVGLVNTTGLFGPDQDPATRELETVSVDGTAAGTTFSLTASFSAAPPADHILPYGEDNIGVDLAAYFVIAYGDNDSDGGFDFDGGDSLYAGSHLEGGDAPDPRFVAWVRPTNMLAALYLDVLEVPSGWQVADDQDSDDDFIKPRAWGEGISLAPDKPIEPPV